jgi:TusA-related sulfurtransferase
VCRIDYTPGPVFNADAFYNAGDRGCGSDVLRDIAQSLTALSSGQLLEIRSTEPSVAVDLPAWCRMVGHQLVAEQSTQDKARHYLVRRSA